MHKFAGRHRKREREMLHVYQQAWGGPSSCHGRVSGCIWQVFDLLQGSRDLSWGHSHHNRETFPFFLYVLFTSGVGCLPSIQPLNFPNCRLNYLYATSLLVSPWEIIEYTTVTLPKQMSIVAAYYLLAKAFPVIIEWQCLAASSVEILFKLNRIM